MKKELFKIEDLSSWKQHEDKLTHKYKHVFAQNKLNNSFFFYAHSICVHIFVLLYITNRESTDKFYARTKIWVKQNIFWYLICKEKNSTKMENKMKYDKIIHIFLNPCKQKIYWDHI